jgi:hypothetical protein
MKMQDGCSLQEKAVETIYPIQIGIEMKQRSLQTIESNAPYPNNTCENKCCFFCHSNPEQ